MTQEEKIRELQERAKEILNIFKHCRWNDDDLTDIIKLLEDLCSL
jgi:hypothetical protein